MMIPLFSFHFFVASPFCESLVISLCICITYCFFFSRRSNDILFSHFGSRSFFSSCILLVLHPSQPSTGISILSFLPSSLFLLQLEYIAVKYDLRVSSRGSKKGKEDGSRSWVGNTEGGWRWNRSFRSFWREDAKSQCKERRDFSYSIWLFQFDPLFLEMMIWSLSGRYRDRKKGKHHWKNVSKVHIHATWRNWKEELEHLLQIVIQVIDKPDSCDKESHIPWLSRI